MQEFVRIPPDPVRANPAIVEKDTLADAGRGVMHGSETIVKAAKLKAVMLRSVMNLTLTTGIAMDSGWTLSSFSCSRYGDSCSRGRR